MTHLPLSPFITDPDHRFVLNEDEFMEAISPDLPAFIASPSPAYLAAAEFEPIVRVLFR